MRLGEGARGGPAALCGEVSWRAVESPVIIDVWRVEPDHREEFLRLAAEYLRRVAVPHPGFVSAELYESASGGVVVVNVRMRTSADRQALSDSREVEEVFRRARGLASSHWGLYRLVESFEAAPGSAGPDEVTA